MPVMDARNNQVYTALYDGMRTAEEDYGYMGIPVSEWYSL